MSLLAAEAVLCASIPAVSIAGVGRALRMRDGALGFVDLPSVSAKRSSRSCVSRHWLSN
ncbi:hypothetical protein BRAS3809_3020003 [Bradyrhizobium sp. STM 3809]|nr:hypothetical protein BRAS3809_3020003 [Bradyrhizobium sp. STM 3809]